METKKVATGKPVEEGQRVVEIGEILGDVQYHYCNHARMASNKWEVRIAFADVVPTGKVDAKTGVVLSHITAKALSRALASLIKHMEETRGEIVDPDETTGVTHLQDKTVDSEKLLSAEEVEEFRKKSKIRTS